MARSTGKRLLPRGCPLYVSAAAQPGLDVYLRGRPEELSILLTDARDQLPALPPHVVAIEPEELLDAGVSRVEQAFDEGVRRWLTPIFPYLFDAGPAYELLWVNVFRQPSLIDRIYDVALAEEVFGRLAPSSIHVIGPLPIWCALLPDQGRERGVPVHEPARARLRRLVRRATRVPVGMGATAALVSLHGVRAFVRLRERQRAEERLAEVRPPAGGSPRLWAALSGRWRQGAWHLVEQVIAPCEAEGIPYGILFAINYGEKDAGRTDERALFDGTTATHRPAAVDQITGPLRLSEEWRIVRAWLPRAIGSCGLALLGGRAFRVSGRTAAQDGDLLGLLRVATNGLLRVMEAEHATARWLEANPEARTVVFGLAFTGEAKVTDRLMQRAGLTTVDYVHAHVPEADLRTAYRTASHTLACWTLCEEVRFRRLGTNRVCEGGYMPRLVAAARQRVGRPRILAATSYLPGGTTDVLSRNLKHARRLAQALGELVAALGNRAEVVLRLHPLEDATLWRRLFEGRAEPTWSREQTLAADLARADLAIVTNSSTFIEALSYGIPVLFHDAPVIEPDSIFALVPDERRFTSGPELVARVEQALAAPDETSHEQRLLQACFGPAGKPRPLLDLLRRIDPELSIVSFARSASST